MKLLIINQHKGSNEEVISHVNNYLKYADPKLHFMELVINQCPDVELGSWIRKINEEYHDVIDIHIYVEPGLSRARKAAYNRLEKLGKLKGRYVLMLGSTNSRFHNAPTKQYIRKLYHPCTLIKCKYEKDIITRSVKFDLYPKNMMTFEDWFNDEYRPDCNICFNDESDWVVKDYINIFDEPYCLEDFMIYYASWKGIHLVKDPLYEAWYNDKGLSKSFSRSSQTSNRLGYAYRAEIMLNAYLNGELYLTASRLKYLAYDLVTLGDGYSRTRDEFNEETYRPKMTGTISLWKLYEGTIVEGLMKWALDRWIKNPKYNHTIKFLEDEQPKESTNSNSNKE